VIELFQYIIFLTFSKKKINKLAFEMKHVQT